MSGLFGGRPKIIQQAAPAATPAPRDDSSREAQERMRRAGQGRGRQSTVLTQFTRRSASGSAPRRTVVGGGS